MQRTTVVVGILIFGSRIILRLTVEREIQCEIGRIPWHGILGAYAEVESRHAETAHSGPLHRIHLDGVALMSGTRIVESILEQYITVEWIVFRRDGLFHYRIIHRRTKSERRGYYLTYIGLHSEIKPLEIIHASGIESLVNRPETGRFKLAAHIDRGYIRHHQIGGALCGPATLAIEIGNFQLVDPHYTILYRGGRIADTYHHHPDVAQRWIAEHRHCIGLALRIAHGVKHGIAHSLLACSLGLVAQFLHIHQGLKSDIESVVLGPHFLPIGSDIGIMTVSGQRERYLIFIIIMLNVGSQSDEQRQFAVAQSRRIVDQLLGMHPHLQPTVIAQILHGVAVDSARIPCCQPRDAERHRLLVELHDLLLGRVRQTADSRRQHIVDRRAA